jgi:hypothetical protein
LKACAVMADLRAEYESPILIHKTGHLVEIEHAETGKILAKCMIGDDDNMERIADILSQKKLPREAMALRRMVQEARRPAGRGIW